MTTDTMQEDPGLKRRNTRLAIGLGILAAAFYIGFILMSVFVY